MSVKNANPTFNYISLSDKKNDLINADYYIELPLDKEAKIGLKNCLLAYYDYYVPDPHSGITYKLFKCYDTVSEEDIKEELKKLDSVKIILVFLKISKDKGAKLIETLNERHLTS